MAFPGVPGGFRELREAGRNHLHLSWYLIVPGITSYDQIPSWRANKANKGRGGPPKKGNKANKGFLPENHMNYVYLKFLLLFWTADSDSPGQTVENPANGLLVYFTEDV